MESRAGCSKSPASCVFFMEGFALRKEQASIMKIKSLIYSRRIIVVDARKKDDGVAVATASFSDAVAKQLEK